MVHIFTSALCGLSFRPWLSLQHHIDAPSRVLSQRLPLLPWICAPESRDTWFCWKEAKKKEKNKQLLRSSVQTDAGAHWSDVSVRWSTVCPTARDLSSVCPSKQGAVGLGISAEHTHARTHARTHTLHWRKEALGVNLSLRGHWEDMTMD